MQTSERSVISISTLVVHPPAGGCTTNVEIAITDREDACMVKGHHNLLFCGDHARKFRHFAQLHKLKLAETGSKSV